MVAETDPSCLGRVRLETRRVADLVPAGYNPRTISPEALAGLGESIGRFGLVQPIIVNARTGNVVGGHQRLKILEAKGVEATDVVVVDVPEAEEKALNLALNSPRISGEWTAEALGLLEEVVGALPDLGESLRLLDLRGDLEKLFPQSGGDIVEDEVPEPPDDPVTKPGDLWLLGNHRLLCGDSGSEKDLDRLLDGAPVHLLNTDPPYNVKVEPRSNNAIAAGLSSFQAPEKRHHQALGRATGTEVGEPAGMARTHGLVHQRLAVVSCAGARGAREGCQGVTGRRPRPGGRARQISGGADGGEQQDPWPDHGSLRSLGRVCGYPGAAVGLR
jgi:hypothetical protein